MKAFARVTIAIAAFGFLCIGLETSFAQAPGIDRAALRTNALGVLAPLPDQMPGAENDSKTLVTLGRSLFFEKRLSQNLSQSCATCHPLSPGHGGVDNQPTSQGALGKRGVRNCPTILNAGFQFRQFWDG